MNLGQLPELIVGKSVYYCDRHIRQAPQDAKETIEWLNNSVLKYLGNTKYCQEIQNKVIDNLDDPTFRNSFVESIKSTNLYVEAPSFSEIDMRGLLKSAINPNETVLIKGQTIDYMKRKLKINLPFNSTDVELPNIFCGPMYTMKLYKLVSKIINSRDLGAVKSITKQPVKGRSKGGGSRLGQMELEGLLASGCEKALKELTTVKSDWSEGKKDLIQQLVKTGEYHLPANRKLEGRTKQVVDTLLRFLKE